MYQLAFFICAYIFFVITAFLFLKVGEENGSRALSKATSTEKQVLSFDDKYHELMKQLFSQLHGLRKLVEATSFESDTLKKKIEWLEMKVNAQKQVLSPPPPLAVGPITVELRGLKKIPKVLSVDNTADKVISSVKKKLRESRQ